MSGHALQDVRVDTCFFDAVNKVSICGVAVISNLTVCDVCVFHAAVFGKMKSFAVLWFLVWSFQKFLWWSHFPSSTGRNQIATRYYAGLGFGLWSCSATAKSTPRALITNQSIRTSRAPLLGVDPTLAYHEEDLGRAWTPQHRKKNRRNTITVTIILSYIILTSTLNVILLYLNNFPQNKHTIAELALLLD